MAESMGQLSVHWNMTHAGKDVENVPSNCLRWMMEQEWLERKYPELKEAIETEIEYRDRFDKHFYD